MSPQQHGRLSEEIYVRRRVAAVVVVIVVVAALIWAAVALGGSGEEKQQPTVAPAATSAVPTSAEAESTGEESTSAEEQESEAPTESRSEEPSAEATTTAVAANKRTCELNDLEITASTSQATFRAGDKPTFYMTVKNPTAADCEINLDQETLRFEVYSMRDNSRIWADVDCNPSEGSGKRTFPKGEERHFESVWSRTTSAPQKCEARSPVEAGSYYLHAVIGNHASPAQPFNLA
ncbi:hypothetical protein [Corynebacterium lowii]|uniref:Intracellular proteinase inhibitor n=1 Tax=Corynebacterium lowii TaxID=1544413 RepID=A0A0N8W0B2_9CORY|nr:hypothetical protein [Corynebacterium lowii]KQB86210.1 hypothetical protein Clow_01564 [Corynebacterium lowii]MDP9852684.1 hypothetical protein [Corynebacterium lowii]